MKEVLIVDDSKMARMMISRCAEIVGMNDVEFIEACNGKEALGKLKAHKIELVFADLNMPLMDGKSMLKWMKSESRLRNIPIIFITSAKNSALEKELITLGAEAVLKKPFSPATMAPVIEKFI